MGLDGYEENLQKQQLAQAAIAQNEIGNAKGQTQYTRDLAQKELELLGTPEQLAGYKPAAQGVSKYQARVSVNDQLFSDSIAGSAPTGVYEQKLRDAGNNANALLAQAETAARAGDYAKADSLYLQAMSQKDTVGHAGVNQEGVWNLNEIKTPTALEEDAKKALSGPAAIGVGGIVNDARQILDPSSKVRTDLWRNLTEQPLKEVDYATELGERGLASGSAEARRNIRNLRVASGAGMSPGMQAAMEGRNALDFSTEQANLLSQAGATRAKILGDASKYVETFSRQWSADALGFAQNWISNQPGVSIEFAKLSNQLSLAGAQLADSMAQRLSGLQATSMELSSRERIADRDRNSAFWGGLLSSFTNIIAQGAAGAATGYMMKPTPKA